MHRRRRGDRTILLWNFQFGTQERTMEAWIMVGPIDFVMKTKKRVRQNPPTPRCNQTGNGAFGFRSLP
jgi:hypothetical protein